MSKEQGDQTLHRGEAENALNDDEHQVLHGEEDDEENHRREDDKVRRARFGDLQPLQAASTRRFGATGGALGFRFVLLEVYHLVR